METQKRPKAADSPLLKRFTGFMQKKEQIFIDRNYRAI